MRRCALSLLLMVWLSGLGGCATVPGAASPTVPVVRDVCFSRAEAAEIIIRIERLQAAVTACKTAAGFDRKKAVAECDALVSRWQIEARACHTKLTACASQKCPSCWLPWLIAGVALTTAATLGVYAAVRR